MSIEAVSFFDVMQAIARHGLRPMSPTGSLASSDVCDKWTCHAADFIVVVDTGPITTIKAYADNGMRTEWKVHEQERV